MNIPFVKTLSAGDFEVISPIRPVIALDDRDLNSPDLDETWEYISNTEGAETKGRPSYAAIVTGVIGVGEVKA